MQSRPPAVRRPRRLWDTGQAGSRQGRSSACAACHGIMKTCAMPGTALCQSLLITCGVSGAGGLQLGTNEETP